MKELFEIYEICNLVLGSVDLMDLIEITQNKDEYKVEANIIAEYIYDNNPNKESLASYIRDVFEEYFDEIFDMEYMILTADCMLKNLGD